MVIFKRSIISAGLKFVLWYSSCTRSLAFFRTSAFCHFATVIQIKFPESSACPYALSSMKPGRFLMKSRLIFIRWVNSCMAAFGMKNLSIKIWMLLFSVCFVFIAIFLFVSDKCWTFKWIDGWGLKEIHFKAIKNGTLQRVPFFGYLNFSVL